MPAFEFKGLNKAGKEVSGVRDADSEKALRSSLKREGIYLTRVGKGTKKGQGLLATEVDLQQYFERISPMDIAIFTRQLATLTRAVSFRGPRVQHRLSQRGKTCNQSSSRVLLPLLVQQEFQVGRRDS